MTCQEFLARHSEYMDDLLSPAEAARCAVHASGCAACARYDRVVRQGVRLLRASPEVEPSSDFFPRLQHRLYNLEEELRTGARGPGSNAIVSLALAGMLALLAWSPLMRLDQVLLPVPAAGEDRVAKETPVVSPDPTPRPLSEIGAPSSLRPLGGGVRALPTQRLIADPEMMDWMTSDPFENAFSGYESALTAPRLAPPSIRYYSPLMTGAPTLHNTDLQVVRAGRDTLSPPD